MDAMESAFSGPLLYLLIVWGVVTAIFLVLIAWRSVLSSHEDDQIFIDDAFSHERTAQTAIVAKVNKVQPVLHAMMVVTAVATLFVIGYYIYDIIHQFK